MAYVVNRNKGDMAVHHRGHSIEETPRGIEKRERNTKTTPLFSLVKSVKNQGQLALILAHVPF